MDDSPVIGQSPRGCRGNPDPAVDPDYGLVRKLLSVLQTWLRSRRCFFNTTILWHVVIFSECHLRRVLSAYVDYYRQARTHLSLDKDCPDTRPVQRSRLSLLKTSSGETECDSLC